MNELHLDNKSDVIASRITEKVLETKWSAGDMAFMGNVKPRYVKIMTINKKRVMVCDIQKNYYQVSIASLTLEPKILDKSVALKGILGISEKDGYKNYFGDYC